MKHSYNRQNTKRRYRFTHRRPRRNFVKLRYFKETRKTSIEDIFRPILFVIICFAIIMLGWGINLLNGEKWYLLVLFCFIMVSWFAAVYEGHKENPKHKTWIEINPKKFY
ncbi:MAG: hypothetical protein JSW08_03125 [archaeon]|nr:MAG: hypothetical protein JSW08_03125 [archaeon]